MYNFSSTEMSHFIVNRMPSNQTCSPSETVEYLRKTIHLLMRPKLMGNLSQPLQPICYFFSDIQNSDKYYETGSLRHHKSMSRGHVNENPFIQIVVIFFFDS